MSPDSGHFCSKVLKEDKKKICPERLRSVSGSLRMIFRDKIETQL